MVRNKLKTQQDVIYLSLLIVIKAVMQFYLYQKGFISVSADEFARGLRAAHWSLQPTFSAATDSQGVWLPFEKYLNGSLLLLWDDVIWAPRATVFLASCLLLISFFALTRLLFQPPTIAYLAALFITFQPWVVWLSGTPMLEMYYLPLFFAGVFFLIKWLQTDNPYGWFWSGLCFMMASGFHVQSWVFLSVINLLTIGFWFRFLRGRENGRFFQLTTFYLLSNSYIIFFTLAEYLYSGKILTALRFHTTYSLLIHNGYQVPVWEKLWYYPQLIVTNTPITVWFLLPITFLFLSQDRERRWKLFLLAVGILSLGTNSVLNVFSGPPSAAPDRYAVFYILLLAPYLSYGCYQSILWSKTHLKSFWAYPLPIVTVTLLLYSIWWGKQRIPHFPPAMPIESVETGQYLNELLNTAQTATAPQPGYLLELKYWEYIAVQLPARHYDTQYFDREEDFYNRNTPSIFLEPPEVILDTLVQNHILYVALYDDALREKALQTEFLLAQKEIGDWTVFKFVPPQD